MSLSPEQQAPEQPLDANERDELRARIQKLEASQVAARLAQEKAQNNIEELKRRNAELRSTSENVDPELRKFVEQDVADAKAKVDKARELVEKNPADSGYLNSFYSANKLYKKSLEQLDVQFPQAQPVPRSMSREQERELQDLREKKMHAQAQVRRDPSDPYATVKFRNAAKAFNDFAKRVYRESGIRLPD